MLGAGKERGAPYVHTRGPTKGRTCAHLSFPSLSSALPHCETFPPFFSSPALRPSLPHLRIFTSSLPAHSAVPPPFFSTSTSTTATTTATVADPAQDSRTNDVRSFVTF